MSTAKIIIDKIKGAKIIKSPRFKKNLKIGLISATILFLITVVTFLKDCEVTTSNKDTVFHETLFARNNLDYTLSQRYLDIRNHPSFNLSSKEYISKAFSNDLNLKNNILNVHQSLRSAQKSAEELMRLLSNSYSNQQTIINRENDIKRSIELADTIGKNLANKLNLFWVIPSNKLTPKEKVKWYEERIMIYNAATDEQVKLRWHTTPIKDKKP